jgi:hypothetical protein
MSTASPFELDDKRVTGSTVTGRRGAAAAAPLLSAAAGAIRAAFDLEAAGLVGAGLASSVLIARAKAFAKDEADAERAAVGLAFTAAAGVAEIEAD